MRPFSLLPLFFFSAFLSFSQERKALNYSMKLEAYIFETYSNLGSVTYAGQTGLFQVAYPIGKRFDLGISAGIYFHYRESRLEPNIYVYSPLQSSLNFHTLNNRFAIEIATGFPFKLSEYKPYIFSNGFWYKDVYSENPEQQFQQNKLYKRNTVFLVSNLNLKFGLGNSEHWFLTTGLRLMNYRRRFKEEGLNQPEYVVKGIESYWNLSFGAEYRF